MISTREEAELMFSKWMEGSSRIFFTAFRPDRTIVNSLCGNVVGISEDFVLIMGEGDSAEVDLREAEFAFVTQGDLPAEVGKEINSSFESGIFISRTDGSMYAFLEIGEQ
jgi:hypothetical protein